ncbi:hypothetical protein HPB49_022796 [Dermacentor silvarum]|uniref:Uncharacterized protein n=1 Tax=Dermacentor silvarum TaxID=543639 RepID=A0ACB8C617_DERSI|nr:hypothetical protein HPB49_022796 [Dermacentor silvarum]
MVEMSGNVPTHFYRHRIHHGGVPAKSFFYVTSSVRIREPAEEQDTVRCACGTVTFCPLTTASGTKRALASSPKSFSKRNCSLKSVASIRSTSRSPHRERHHNSSGSLVRLSSHSRSSKESSPLRSRHSSLLNIRSPISPRDKTDSR